MTGEIEGRIVEARFDRDEMAAVFKQSFTSGRKVVGYMQIPAELPADAAAYNQVIDAQLDRTFRPWRYPDPNPFPVIDLSPRWTRFRVATSPARASRGTTGTEP